MLAEGGTRIAGPEEPVAFYDRQLSGQTSPCGRFRSYWIKGIGGDQFALLRLDSNTLPAPSHLEQTSLGFVITVQLRPIDRVILRQSGHIVFRGPLPVGAVSIMRLDENPRYDLAGDYDCAQILMPGSVIEEIAQRYGMPHVDGIASALHVVDHALRHALSTIVGLCQLRDVTEGILERLTELVCVHLIDRYGVVSSTRRDHLGLAT